MARGSKCSIPWCDEPRYGEMYCAVRHRHLEPEREIGQFATGQIGRDKRIEVKRNQRIMALLEKCGFKPK